MNMRPEDPNNSMVSLTASGTAISEQYRQNGVSDLCVTL
jgi:hypothetical protein